MRSDGLEKEMMLACGEGSRKQGWPKKRWMDALDVIHETPGKKFGRTKRCDGGKNEMEKLDHDGR